MPCLLCAWPVMRHDLILFPLRRCADLGPDFHVCVLRLILPGCALYRTVFGGEPCAFGSDTNCRVSCRGAACDCRRFPTPRRSRPSQRGEGARCTALPPPSPHERRTKRAIERQAKRARRGARQSPVPDFSEAGPSQLQPTPLQTEPTPDAPAPTPARPATPPQSARSLQLWGFVLLRPRTAARLAPRPSNREPPSGPSPRSYSYSYSSSHLCGPASRQLEWPAAPEPPSPPHLQHLRLLVSPSLSAAQHVSPVRSSVLSASWDDA